MDISNKTKRPLSVPLPGGKKLHLGPGKTGQISDKAADHPALQKLIEAGEIEIVSEGRSQGTFGSSGKTSKGESQGGPPSAGVRHTGDR
jgi:hypothetical protein